MFKPGYQCGKSPSAGIVNQWGSPAASSVKHILQWYSRFKILKQDGRGFRIYPYSLFKVRRISRLPLVNKTQSRVHLILECKLNIMSEFLKGL